jgi:hypothetical protein
MKNYNVLFRCIKSKLAISTGRNGLCKFPSINVQIAIGIAGPAFFCKAFKVWKIFIHSKIHIFIMITPQVKKIDIRILRNNISKTLFNVFLLGASCIKQVSRNDDYLYIIFPGITNHICKGVNDFLTSFLCLFL